MRAKGKREPESWRERAGASEDGGLGVTPVRVSKAVTVLADRCVRRQRQQQLRRKKAEVRDSRMEASLSLVRYTGHSHIAVFIACGHTDGRRRRRTTTMRRRR